MEHSVKCSRIVSAAMALIGAAVFLLLFNDWWDSGGGLMGLPSGWPE
jgi:hypothetical protein